MNYEIGDRVYYAYGRMKGAIRTKQTNIVSPLVSKYQLDWDFEKMSRTVWVPGWQLKPIPPMEQLAEAAE